MTVSRTICLGFFVVILVGSLLLTLPISTSSSVDISWAERYLVGLFTATSAVCVTGLSVVDPGTYFSGAGQFFLAALVQIGGLGYMTATTFLLLLLGRRFGLRDKVAIQQALDRPGMQGAAQVIRSIMATTLLFEITGTFLLLPAFVPQYGFDQGLWLAIFHSVNSWNNAGFSLFRDSFIGYQSSALVTLTVTGLIIFGGIGYEAIFEAYLWARTKFRQTPEQLNFSLNFKVATSTTVLLLLVGTLAFWLIERVNPDTLGSMNLGSQWLAAWFQSVTPRTAGFNTIDIGKMTTAGLFVTIVLMFIGASPGGTGGGIKTTTLRVLSSCTKAILRGREDAHLYDRQIPLSLVLKAVGVLVGSLVTVLIATLVISLTDAKLTFLQILFEVVSAFATVGLSTGITAAMSVPAKLVIITTMYCGRVGVLLLMSALLGDPTPSSVRYPEENLLVG